MTRRVSVSPRVIRWLVPAVALSLTLTVGQLADPTPAVAGSRVKAAPTASVESRADLVSATVTARAQGSRVEVEDLRTESSTTWVNPDGTMTTEAHAGPIRYRDGKGAWRDVDLALAELPDGTVAPKGHPGGLSLAGSSASAGRGVRSAGETDLTAVAERPGKGQQTRGVVLGWPGRLGRPELHGSSATYREVRPGVDLVVDVRRTGYEEHVVVKSASSLEGLLATSGSKPLSWTLPVKTQGLTARGEDDGSVSFVDANGVVASRLAAPMAWDAAVDSRTGDHASTSRVEMTVRQKGKNRAEVTLTPDQQWLTDPARQFPITIDPTYASATLSTGFDTYVQSNVSSTDKSTETELRAGTWDGGTTKTRSYINFDASSVVGKTVMSATSHLYETYSYSCNARPLQIRAALSASTATRWSSQPATSTTYSTTVIVAKGYSSSCADGWVNTDITNIAKMWAAGTETGRGLALFAGDETDSYGYKKFASRETANDPYVTFTYDRKPNAAAEPTMPGVSPYQLDSGITQLFTRDSTPAFSSTASDPDNDNVSVTFEVHTSTTASAATLVANCTTAFVASGSPATCSISAGEALPENGAYYVRAAVKDDQGVWNGTWSSWAKFYTTWAEPPAATVACTDGYGVPPMGWTDQAPTHDIVCDINAHGTTGTYVAPGYLDLVIDGASKRVQITPTNSTTATVYSVTFARTPDGPHTLEVTPITRSLVEPSTPTQVAFGWGGAGMTYPTAGTASSGSVKISASAPPRGSASSVTATTKWRVAGAADESTGWTAGPSKNVTSASSTALVTYDGAFDLATAVREQGASVDLPSRTPVLLDVQVCFAYAGLSADQCTWSQSPVSVTRLPHAFGAGYPVADAGPGQVALFTGEFAASSTDAEVPGFAGALSLSRSHTSFAGDGTTAGWPADPATGVFGPGWTANLDGPDDGDAGLLVVDSTRQDGTIALVDEDGSALVWRTSSKNRIYTPGTYLPVTQDTIDTGLRLTSPAPSAQACSSS